MSITTETPVEVDQAPLDSLYEVIDGVRVEKPPMANEAVWVASILVRILGTFAHANRLGRVVGEMLFKLHAGRPQRRPDAAFVSYERWPRDRRIPQGEGWEVVPDLAIEVISPSNTSAAMQRKIREYFNAGVQRVWVVYPEEHLIQVYSSPRQVRGLGDGDDLDGEDLLPGFRLPVAELFEDVDAPAE